MTSERGDNWPEGLAEIEYDPAQPPNAGIVDRGPETPFTAEWKRNADVVLKMIDVMARASRMHTSPYGHNIIWVSRPQFNWIKSKAFIARRFETVQ